MGYGVGGAWFGRGVGGVWVGHALPYSALKRYLLEVPLVGWDVGWAGRRRELGWGVGVGGTWAGYGVRARPALQRLVEIPREPVAVPVLPQRRRRAPPVGERLDVDHVAGTQLHDGGAAALVPAVVGVARAHGDVVHHDGEVGPRAPVGLVEEREHVETGSERRERAVRLVVAVAKVTDDAVEDEDVALGDDVRAVGAVRVEGDAGVVTVTVV